METNLIEINEFQPNEEFNVNTETNNNNQLNYSGGKITELIGTGENAKNSIAYLVLQWCFRCLSTLIILTFLYAIIYSIFFGKDCNLFSDNLVKVCGIVTPIITLLLGYVFGSRRDGYVENMDKQ